MMAKQTITIDATGQSLGRLASRIALSLLGKHRADFRPNGGFPTKVVVKHCRNVALTGRKLDQKVFARTSGHPGAVKYTKLREMMERDPRTVLVRAVRGMLPANKQRKAHLLRLTIENE